MVLRVNVPDGASVVVDGQPVPWAKPTGERFLGLIFDKQASAKAMAEHRAACMLTAYRCARAKLSVQNDVPGSIPVMLKILQAQVVPVGTYGCELWGLLTIPGICSGGGAQLRLEQLYSLKDILEQKRCWLLKSWLRLPAGTASICLLHELGCEPMVHEYVRRAVRWWNTLVSGPQRTALHLHLLQARGGAPQQQGQEAGRVSPYYRALKQNVVDGIDKRVTNYSLALFSVLRLVMGENQLASNMRQLRPIDLKAIDAALEQKYASYVSQLKLPAGGRGSMVAYYFREMACEEMGERPCWYNLHIPHAVMVGVLRLRLGQHHLRVNTDRWLSVVPAREQRLCSRCSLEAVDDETHCLLTCEDPVIVWARRQLYLTLLQQQPEVHASTAGEVFRCVRNMDHDGKHRCMAFVSTCYQVARKAFTNLDEWQASARYQQAVAKIQAQEVFEEWGPGGADFFDTLSSSLLRSSDMAVEEEGSELSEVVMPMADQEVGSGMGGEDVQ